jgi:hypothetical protein
MRETRFARSNAINLNPFKEKRMMYHRRLNFCMNSKSKSLALISILAIGIIVFFGCSHREKVLIPPRMDLRPYGTIGIIEFSSNSESELGQDVTQRYMQTLQAAQPGVRILELGTKEQVLKKIRLGQLDPEAIRAIGKAYRVDALTFGQLSVSEPKPNVRLSSTWESLQAGADIEASLITKLWETASGATLWTRSSRRTETVASLGADTSGNVSFGATDPSESYGKLVPNLVWDNTHDFRSHYEWRKVK